MKVYYSVLLILFFCYFVSINKKTYIQGFRVKDNKHKHVVVQELDIIQDKIDNLKKALYKSSHKNTYGVKRLLETNVIELEESFKNHVGYSINKGEKIGVCVISDGILQDRNAIFYIVMHELAHIMTEEYGHNDEFWDHLSILVEVASQTKIYSEPLNTTVCKKKVIV